MQIRQTPRGIGPIPISWTVLSHNTNNSIMSVMELPLILILITNDGLYWKSTNLKWSRQVQMLILNVSLSFNVCVFYFYYCYGLCLVLGGPPVIFVCVCNLNEISMDLSPASSFITWVLCLWPAVACILKRRQRLVYDHVVEESFRGDSHNIWLSYSPSVLDLLISTPVLFNRSLSYLLFSCFLDLVYWHISCFEDFPGRYCLNLYCTVYFLISFDLFLINFFWITSCTFCWERIGSFFSSLKNIYWLVILVRQFRLHVGSPSDPVLLPPIPEA